MKAFADALVAGERRIRTISSAHEDRELARVRARRRETSVVDDSCHRYPAKKLLLPISDRL